jgi:hypothetical protein
MFFIKKKSIVLDCFTANKDVYDFAPIQKASNFYPQWFKNMPPTYEVEKHFMPTLKTCEGFIGYYQHGIIMPLWCDLALRIEDKNFFLSFSDLKTSAVFHSPEQWKSFADPSKVGHFKINTPWAFKCKEEINFLLKNPYWHYEPFMDFDIVEGIVNYKYQSTTNVNIFLKINQSKIINVNFKNPLAHIIPLSDRRIEIKNHLISEEEFKNINRVPLVSFTNNYQTYKKELTKKTKKCPFGY